ncbi:DUF1016 N-terminal domain-containing protein [Nocardia stercoris]|uniref:Uncharacterized protein n=1 Tax=Nocardia stercoris TaxID=2483361 RepID=A0A3M2KUX1_9NOCA|nr:DUF1016 domain-containing protein [Nocardia stercoris]RMI28951.1 hypothetical protein EBN03_27830 [Nocardia stercoris]
MSDLKPAGGPSVAGTFEQGSALIETAGSAVAPPANAPLALMNWQIGHLIDTKRLQQQRAEYGVALREFGSRRDDEDHE